MLIRVSCYISGMKRTETEQEISQVNYNAGDQIICQCCGGTLLLPAGDNDRKAVFGHVVKVIELIS